MFYLTIAALDTVYFEGEVSSCTCPGQEGELTILANHEPLITLLKEGVITIRKTKGEEVQTFDVKRGLLEVARSRATVLI